MTQLFSYLVTAIEERVAERGWPIFGVKLKARRHNVQIFPFVHLICFWNYKSLFLNTPNANMADRSVGARHEVA